MIRKFQNTDLKNVLNIWLEGNLQAHSFIAAKYWQENYDKMANVYLPQAEIWVYEDQQKIKGFIGLQGDYIAGLFVAKDAQGQGIGTKLLDYVKKERIQLSLQVYEKNSHAISFYLAANFYIVKKELDKNVQEIEYLMEWKNNAD
ncbi:N-acetyltransferase [Lactobacillus kefiranofaciens]|uniref:N-acetyltransferase n=1 Tax=Lactobacillus kefiranofaciens TaxID=267818 RepID=UPI0024698C6C|nr:N-acetyltransferase [Lactobacillus kefiranofaciens]MDH5100055.1 N-acetyltransferase [Lactobacillus kefiranofaciens]